jgi:hypothetical protein
MLLALMLALTFAAGTAAVLTLNAPKKIIIVAMLALTFAVGTITVLAINAQPVLAGPCGNPSC